jgi:hypothetical protein
MNTKTLLASLAVLALVAGGSTAHGRAYVTGSDIVAICFNEGGDLQDVPSVGGTCFAAGHVTPDLSGQNTITIVDSAALVAGGIVCQDLNGDNWCGNDLNGSPGNELGEIFCATKTITDTSNGGLWDPSADTWVFVFGPILGVFDIPNGIACGTFSASTSGEVVHT